jgi:D-sedoheptulose 7-phosphate isomerase
MKEQINRIFDGHAQVQEAFLKKHLDGLVEITEILVDAFRKGRKVLFFGNGGSAADAQHLAAEFVNRFREERRALPALALTTDSSVLTSIANDRSYEQIFSRQVEALGRRGDVAVGITTSGASPNVLEGIRAARREGLITVAFAGGEGGMLLRETDYCLLVPSHDTARVQETHIVAGHAICELVERAFTEKGR